jgi:hypothetical protein
MNPDDTVQVLRSQPSKPAFQGPSGSARYIPTISPSASEDAILTPDDKDYDCISNILSRPPTAQYSEYPSVSGGSDDMDFLLSDDRRDKDTENSQISEKDGPNSTRTFNGLKHYL